MTLRKAVLKALTQGRHPPTLQQRNVRFFQLVTAKKPGTACMALPGFSMGQGDQVVMSMARAKSAMASMVWSRGANTLAVPYCTKLRRIDCR